ncbi:unnamed protein product [Orchesella dallaii]|uniref:Uncharacterized protein n=1 Tax=Orchesella dallaii TaxID=48710 RepID=A0ABP1RW86_9HEXA
MLFSCKFEGVAEICRGNSKLLSHGKSDLPVASITEGQKRPDSSRVGKRDLPVASITEGPNHRPRRLSGCEKVAALSGISQRRRPWEGKRILVAECTLTNGQSMLDRKLRMGNHVGVEAPHGLSCPLMRVLSWDRASRRRLVVCMLEAGYQPEGAVRFG